MGPLLPSRPDPTVIAQLLHEVRTQGATLESSQVAIGDLAAAYEVQRALTSLRLRSKGTRVVGWKLGYTSEAMRRQMGIDGPNYGPLLTSMVVPDGAVLGSGLLQPRVEPEVLLVLGRDVDQSVDTDGALAACSGARVALEVVDSVWTGYRFDLEHNTADGSSAAHVVIGPALPMGDLAGITVTIHRNGVPVGAGTGAAAAGHPAAALAWLAGELLRQGARLRRGDIVITGGLTAAVDLDPGDVVRADFASGPSVTAGVSVRRQ